MQTTVTQNRWHQHISVDWGQRPAALPVSLKPGAILGGLIPWEGPLLTVETARPLGEPFFTKMPGAVLYQNA
jgi:hypothetical protein